MSTYTTRPLAGHPKVYGRSALLCHVPAGNRGYTGGTRGSQIYQLKGIPLTPGPLVVHYHTISVNIENQNTQRDS